MSEFPSMTLSEWEAVLGDAVRQLRIDAGLSQMELADRANASRSAIQALETGRGSRLRTLLAALRALDRGDAFDMIMPPVGPSPMEMLVAARRAAKKRERVQRSLRLRGSRA